MEEITKRDIKGRFAKGHPHNYKPELRVQQTMLIPCGCDCGELIPKLDKKFRPNRFKRGHRLDNSGRFQKGFKHSDKAKEKIALASRRRIPKLKEHPKNPALHIWVNRYSSKPKNCQMCGENKKLDLANVTGIYNREFKNWKYFCRKCHIAYDNNVGKSWITKRKKIRVQSP